MADIQFGQFTGRHNFRLGEDQVDRVYLGEDAVWINNTTQRITVSGQAITWTLPDPNTIIGVPGVELTENFVINGTFPGREIADTPTISPDLPDGLTISHSYPSTGQNNTIRLTITGEYPLTSNDIDLVISNLTIYTFVTYTVTHSNGGVGSGVSIPGTATFNRRSDQVPFTYNTGTGGGGTTVSGLTWTVRTSTSATGTGSGGVSGSGTSFTVSGNGNISWSGGSVTNQGTINASIGGSASVQGGGLTSWASVGSFNNNTGVNVTVGGGVQSFQSNPGTSTSIGAFLSFGSSAGPTTQPQGNQNSFNSGNPHGVGSQTLAPFQSCTIYLGTQTSTSQALSGGITVFLDGNGVRQRDITGITYSN